MIKPTVGRVVWYYPPVDCKVSGFNTYEGPYAAQIAFVHNDTLVNLGVLDAGGVHHAKPSVHLIETSTENNPRPMHAYCTWMPYQMGQAAKTEEALGRAADKVPGEQYAKEAHPHKTKKEAK